jgi:PrtD family type I secretion system ABC transporter
LGAPRTNALKRGLAAVRGGFFVVGVFSLFINFAALIVPLYMMQIYDRVLASRSPETLIALTALALALLLIVIFVEIARSRVLVRIGAELDSSLGAPLFATAIDERAPAQQAAASQPLRDLETMRTFMTGSGVLALFDAPWTPIYLAIIYLFHPWLGVVATLGALIILTLAIASEIAVRAPLREAGSSTRWSNELIEIFARSSHAIRVMGMLGRLEALWQSHRRDGVAWQALASDRLAILQAVAKTVRLSLQVAILGVGAWLVINGATTAGIMIAASIVMSRALAPVEMALGQWRGFVNARASYQRLKVALEGPGSLEERMSLPEPIGRLEADNVGLRLAEGAPPVLSSVTFTIEAGETLGLIGPSGAGKTSLARLLVGISAPTLGSVRLDGVEVSGWPKEELGQYLGYLPQEIELLGGTVAQNISRFRSVEAPAIVAAAKLAGAHEMILHLPQGYETIIENGGRNISGGQRQRLGLARALFGDTRLVVLDEPNANLDSDGEMALRRALAILKQRRRTVIVITHKPLLLSAADKLMVLNQGRVTLFGPSQSVMAEMAARFEQAGPRTGKVTPLARQPASSSAEIDDAQTSLSA